MIKYTFINLLKNEGAGSLLQRELFAYFAAQIMKVEFIGFPNEFMIGHEPNYISKDKLNSDWGLIRQKIGDYVDKKIDLEKIIYVNSINALNLETSKYILSTDLKLFSIDFNLSHEIFSTQSKLVQQELVNNFRKKFNSNYNFERGDYIAMHLRCCSKADDVFGIDTLPWQHFNVDYGIHNNNPKFYFRLYRGLLRKILTKSRKKIRQKLRVYSTCSEADLEIFLESLADDFEVELIINGYSFDDFLDLSTANVLIAAHSSFSWLALFLNPNETYIRSGFRHILPHNTIKFDDTVADDYNFGDFILTVLTKVNYLKYRVRNYFKRSIL